MAIKTATIQVRMGLESELDISKAVPGEWLLSTDTKYIRMCVAYGIVLRMATYEAFEADMAKIKELVSTAQSVKSIVIGLASEVGSKTTIVLEATEEAKAYMEEAKKYSELAFATTPDGYEVLVNDVNTLKESITQTSSRTHTGSYAGGEKLIGIKGASEQKQYSGAQLLNYEAWKNVGVGNGTAVFEDNGVTITATGSDAYTLYNTADFPEGARIEVNEGDVVTITWETDSDNSGLVYIFGNAGTGSLVNAYAKVGKAVYTVPSGITFITFRFGATYAGTTISYKNIMINKGDTALPWEPYVGNAPSPSSEYPQEIESVGDSGSLVIEQVGKNLWAYGDYTFIQRKRIDLDKPLSPGTYFVSAVVTSTDTDNITCLIGFIGGDKDGNILYRSIARNNRVTINATIYNQVSAIYLMASGNYDNGKGDTATWKDIMIHKADIEDDTYEPYQSNIITIPLNEPLRGIDDCKDGFVFKYERWRIERNCYGFWLNGSENWQINDYNNSYYSDIVNGITASGVITKMLSDSYIFTTEASSQMADKTIKTSWSGETSLIILRDTSYANVAELKAGLAKNPVFCVVKRAEPIYEDIEDQTPFYGLKSFDTVTYISTDSKVEPEVIVKYGKTEVGALTLENYNRTKLNEIRVSATEALLTELSAALVAGSEV